MPAAAHATGPRYPASAGKGRSSASSNSAPWFEALSPCLCGHLPTGHVFLLVPLHPTAGPNPQMWIGVSGEAMDQNLGSPQRSNNATRPAAADVSLNVN